MFADTLILRIILKVEKCNVPAAAWLSNFDMYDGTQNFLPVCVYQLK
jgi:hypothetical protein